MFIKMIKNIRECNECGLREQALDVIQRIYGGSIGWTFYGEPDYQVKPKHMFLMQNPGLSEKSSTEMQNEFNDIERCKDSDVLLINLMKKQLLRWLVDRNTHFAKTFITILQDKRMHLISNTSWPKYFGFETNIEKANDLANYQTECSFFKDFCVTDIVKCRGLTNWLFDKDGGNCEYCYNKFLIKEISILKPDIVFCFGARTWNILKRVYDLECYKGVLAEHGKVISNNNEHFRYVMPLAHFSRRNFFIRDSYYSYLKEGIETYTVR